MNECEAVMHRFGGAFSKPRVQSGAFQEDSLKIIEVGVGGRAVVDESRAISGAVDSLTVSFVAAVCNTSCTFVLYNLAFHPSQHCLGTEVYWNSYVYPQHSWFLVTPCRWVG